MLAGSLLEPGMDMDGSCWWSRRCSAQLSCRLPGRAAAQLLAAGRRPLGQGQGRRRLKGRRQVAASPGRRMPGRSNQFGRRATSGVGGGRDRRTGPGGGGGQRVRRGMQFACLDGLFFLFLEVNDRARTSKWAVANYRVLGKKKSRFGLGGRRPPLTST